VISEPNCLPYLSKPWALRARVQFIENQRRNQVGDNLISHWGRMHIIFCIEKSRLSGASTSHFGRQIAKRDVGLCADARKRVDHREGFAYNGIRFRCLSIYALPEWDEYDQQLST